MSGLRDFISEASAIFRSLGMTESLVFLQQLLLKDKQNASVSQFQHI